jgi:hypothetical protein
MILFNPNLYQNIITIIFNMIAIISPNIQMILHLYSIRYVYILLR